MHGKPSGGKGQSYINNNLKRVWKKNSHLVSNSILNRILSYDYMEKQITKIGCMVG